MLQAKVMFPITVKAMPPMHPDSRAAAAAQDLDRLAVVDETFSSRQLNVKPPQQFNNGLSVIRI